MESIIAGLIVQVLNPRVVVSSRPIYYLPIKIKPSKMEVAPLHRTVDITQKRVLFKNTKKTKKGY